VSSLKVVIYVDDILSKFIVNDRHYKVDNVYMHYLIYIDDSSLQLSQDLLLLIYLNAYFTYM